MKFFFKKIEVIFFILIVSIMLFLHRDLFLKDKIIFPSNFLAQFYSPWSTFKFPGWETGIPHKPLGSDPIRSFYPDRALINEAFRNGYFPLWNPYVFAGTPLLANFHSGVFYPLHAIYFIFPQIASWSILIFSQPLLAFFFTYLYLRSINLEKMSALLGAFIFAFSNTFTIWSQENPTVTRTVMWLPLVLYSIEKYLKNNRYKYFMLAVFALATSFLAGFLQVAFYVYLFSFIYAIVRIFSAKNNRFINLIVLITIYLLSLLLSSVQFFPSLEAFSNSPRPTSSIGYLFDTYLLPLSHIINFFVSDIFGSAGSYNFFGRGAYHETVISIGAVSMFFSIYAIFSSIKNKLVLFFALTSFLSFFLTLENPITRLFYQIPFPLISTFLPSRLLIITVFSLSVLSAFGIERVFNSERNKKAVNYIFLFIFLILFFALSYSFILKYFDSAKVSLINDYIIRKNHIFKEEQSLIIFKNSFLSSIFVVLLFILLKIRIKKVFSLILLIVLIFLGQFYYLNKQLVLGYRQFLYPKHPILSFLQEKAGNERFIVFNNPILGNIWEEKKIYSPEGMDPLYPIQYGQLSFASTSNGRLETKNVPRIEVRLSELEEREKITQNFKRLRFLSLLGVKYFVFYEDPKSSISLSKRFPSNSFPVLVKSADWYVFENASALPRAFLAEDYLVEKSPQKIFDTLFNPNFNISKKVILEEKPLMIKNSKMLRESTVNIRKYLPGKVSIDVKSSENRILFLSDNYYPGWKASVDGNQTDIYKANYSFMSVVVPAGKHKVDFYYDPLSFKIGIMISVLTFFLVFGIYLYINFFKKILKK